MSTTQDMPKETLPRFRERAIIYTVIAVVSLVLLPLSLYYRFPNPFVYLVFSLTFGALARVCWYINKRIEAQILRWFIHWEEETRYSSMFSHMREHPLYKKITSQGKVAIRVLLKELEKRQCHAFVFLAEITGENPVLPKHCGKVSQMRNDWLAWGKKNGYL